MRLLGGCILVAALLGGAATTAPALSLGGAGDLLPRPPQAEERRQSREPRITPAQAAARARKQHGGKVLDVHLEGGHYRVKLLKDGNVRSVRVPAD